MHKILHLLILLRVKVILYVLLLLFICISVHLQYRELYTVPCMRSPCVFSLFVSLKAFEDETLFERQVVQARTLELVVVLLLAHFALVQVVLVEQVFVSVPEHTEQLEVHF